MTRPSPEDQHRHFDQATSESDIYPQDNTRSQQDQPSVKLHKNDPLAFPWRRFTWSLAVVFSLLFIPLIGSVMFPTWSPGLLALLSTAPTSIFATAADISKEASVSAGLDLSWHAPARWQVNSLASAINGTGTYGFIFDSSQTPRDVPPTTYNWCNMPHVHPDTYPRLASKHQEYELVYVEVIHRHHKRSPYASNAFPVEAETFDCSDAAVSLYGNAAEPGSHAGNQTAQTFYARGVAEPNPFKQSGFKGSCAFPQLTHGGLDDSWQHGRDLWNVYGAQLRLIPRNPSPRQFRISVSNNIITNQVAGMLLNGMLGIEGPYPVHVEPPDIAALEPTYSCPAAQAAYGSYGVGGTAANWTAHLQASSDLFQSLDAISGVDPADSGWHQSWDHYFDNLSARLCHAKPLPCSLTDNSRCVTPAMADKVFRLGELEYSFIYRDAPQSLAAAAASYGVWVAQLGSHLRDAASDSKSKLELKYRHNVAHDGSVSRLLSILQLDKMVWPGMGSEVVFELYRDPSKEYFVRILWSGQVLQSSSPVLGRAEMVPLRRLLQYFDGLVGVDGELVPGKCSTST